MQVDRYKSDRDPRLYLLVGYRQAIPNFENTSGSTFSAAGASDTRAYPEALCNEIEEAIRSRGYWLGDLP